MKVTHFSHRFSPCLGGVEEIVEKLCIHLKENKVESSVVCLNRCPNSDKELPAKEVFLGIPVERMAFLDLRYYKIAPEVLSRIGECDIVHVHGMGFFSDMLALTKFWHKKKLVLSTHGGIFHTKDLGLIKKAYFFGLNRLLLRAFDKVVAVSKADYETFAKVVSEDKLVLIENPVELRKAGRKSRQKNSFLFVGRLSKNKQVDRLLEAFALVVKEKKGASLFVAGEDFEGLQKELEEKARQLGIEKKVFFEGRVSDEELSNLYSACEFFVSASNYEGFGITSLEAMTSELVPVLNSIPSFEDFASDGRGILTDFSDRKEAARAMLRAIALKPDEKQAIVAKNKLFCRTFSWDKKIADFLELYKEILAK